jgi:DNA-binding transcriptional ArsR family regulator
MVVGSVDAGQADRVFHALADSTRREILALVLHGEHSVSDLARRHPISFAAVQKHVVVLERAGLVSKRRQGREQRVRGNPDALRDAHRLLDRLETVWRARIHLIGEILADPTEPAGIEREPTETEPGPTEGARP